MNYYEQFYDDLEFCDEEEQHHNPRRDEQQDRGYNEQRDRGYNEQRDRGYNESWTHRDEMYESPDRPHHREHDREHDRERSYDREPSYEDYETSYNEYRDDWEHERWQGYNDRYWGPRNRGRGFNHRGRGYNQRGRGFNQRGRGFNQRGRGHFHGDEGDEPKGKLKGALKMNFVKARETTEFVPSKTEAGTSVTDSKNKIEAVVGAPALPVLSSYGYGAGSDFQEFGCAQTGTQQTHNFDPGVPGETTPSVELPTPSAQLPTPSAQLPTPAVSSQPVPTTTQAQKPVQAQPSKVITAVVRPMYSFVKAKSEFKSTDVAFHETSTAGKTGPINPAVDQPKNRAGIGMPAGQKVTLQSFDVVTAFHAKAKDGYNPVFDAKFERLREAIKACNVANKNSIEIIHMAVDKIKMKITDINNPGSRNNTGQAMFMCRLEIDGVHVAQGFATNKKLAKHEAYNNAKCLFDSGTVTVKETAPGCIELKQKEAFPVAPNSTPVPGKPVSGKPVPGKTVKTSAQTNTSSVNLTYNKPQIVFHQPGPLANKPLDFRASNSGASQNYPQSGSSPGELAMKLLNFVKEGTSAAETQKKETVKSQPALGAPRGRNPTTPNQNMLKRALNSATAGNLRVKKAKCGPLSLEDLSQFIIIDNSLMYPNLSDISILHASANHNKVVLKFEYEIVREGYQCNTVLGVHTVSSCIGKSKEESKLAAAKEALDHLRQICYSVKVKQDVDNDADGMTKSDLQLGEKQNEQIPDSNIGNMLLRKMGWIGGGVGKDGKGIAEPVKAEMVIGREGLGLKAEQGIGKDFEKNVNKMLTDYIKSDDQRDLHFSSELAKEERAVIHQMGQKMGLKTQSKGKGDNRYLIVSRKRSASQLLDHVIGCGGSTDKYEVVAPANPDVDPRKREAINFGHCKQ